jgi:hypothetical protein
VVRLKREMAAISAQDDFARWAKLRRQHDKALEEHDKKGARALTSWLFIFNFWGKKKKSWAVLGRAEGPVCNKSITTEKKNKAVCSEGG